MWEMNINIKWKLPSFIAEQVENERKMKHLNLRIFFTIYSLFISLVFPETKLRETNEINQKIESFTFKHLRNSKKWMTLQSKFSRPD